MSTFSVILAEKLGHEISEYRSNDRQEVYISVNRDEIIPACAVLQRELDGPLVLMFAADERVLSGNYAVYYTFASRRDGRLVTLKTPVQPENMTIPSICLTFPSAAAYEREIQDLFGIIPQGHPDPKRLVLHGNWPEGLHPLRKDYAVHHRPEFARHEITFTEVQGDGVYEIPVGPVHAGIIEPGHFRFSVAGEPIVLLEAQLYYVHKGIEKLAEGMTLEKGLFLAERVSGDESVANALAYCQAVEKIAGVNVPLRAQYTRVLLAELERLISHLGDLGGICLDVGYGFGNSQFTMLRGWAYNLADELCGRRFLRSTVKPGGLRRDCTAGREIPLSEGLYKLRDELSATVDIIQSNSMLIDRVEHTGILAYQIAVDLNATGPAGRASGMTYDVRKSFPYEVYDRLKFKIPEHHNGDVNCRMNVKIEESFQAIELMLQTLKNMPLGEINVPIGPLDPYRQAFGLTESPKGENLHWLMTGEGNTIYRYKIRTPSFGNWAALCHAVRGNIVPDFPLINKSFNLSYAGNDL
ncbi:MAG: NADH-quinone oxidoreductase subunit C [Peptococcaceae bacterium]|jgi:Ni,Fe-hydrogenase III large subunit/Ni,Fe-hydrogenase III component G|nr:NADH-quinone oxidoreductase subunit C [Peptococcaceae bacterium]